MPAGSLQNSPNCEDLPLRQQLARLRVLCEMLDPEVGFQFFPTLGGVTQGREIASLVVEGKDLNSGRSNARN